MNTATTVVLALGLLAASQDVPPATITAAGQPAELSVRAAGDRSVRLTLKPISMTVDLPDNPALAERAAGTVSYTHLTSPTSGPTQDSGVAGA